MRLSLLLNAFPTTLPDDQEMVDGKGSNKLGHIRTMCIQYRILEKRMLTDALAYVNDRVKVLEQQNNTQSTPIGL